MFRGGKPNRWRCIGSLVFAKEGEEGMGCWWWMSQCPCRSGDDIPRAAARPHVATPSFRMMRLFGGRSRQASFTRAAGNNIVPAFGRVGAHIWDRSIRNRPQCGTINLWPLQQICAVTAECGTINQTQGEKPALSRPSLRPAVAPQSSLPDGPPAYSPPHWLQCYRIITGGAGLRRWVGTG